MKSRVLNAGLSPGARLAWAARTGWSAFAAAVLGAVVATPTALATESSTATTDPFGDGIRIGETMPDFTAVDQQGNLWSLSQETDKVVILHACALWCDPCKNLSLGLNEAIERLETEFGPETFEVVEVLTGDIAAGTTDLLDAQTWAGITGGGLTVLHSDGDPHSHIEAFLYALPRAEIPQLIVLDSRRRVADARGIPGTAATAEDAFRKAILHGLAVSEFPTDLSYDWSGPTQVTLESSVRRGTGEFPPPPDDTLASFADDNGDAWSILFGSFRSDPGSVGFWNRDEIHQLVIQPGSFDAAAEAITLKLGGYLWDDAYPRVVRTVLGGELVAPDLATITGITGIEAEVSADGILTIGPIDIRDRWAQLTVVLEVGAMWVAPKTPAELVQELIDQIESAGLSTGSYRSLAGPLNAAKALLGDDNLANDGAGRAGLQAVADRLRRGGFRDLPSELAASWATALEALTD